MMTLGFLVIIVFLLLVIFFVIVYPLWTIIQCAISPLSKLAKVIWILVMFFTWPLGSIVYGIFGSGKKLFKWFSSIAIVTGLAFFIFTAWAMNYLMSESIEGVQTKMAAIKQMSNETISKEELMNLNSSLLSLQEEMKGSWWQDFDAKFKAVALLEYFDLISEDHRITVEEYNNWMDKFENRHTMTRKALEDFVEELKKKKQSP